MGPKPCHFFSYFIDFSIPWASTSISNSTLQSKTFGNIVDIKECQESRLTQRHGSEARGTIDHLSKMYMNFDSPQDDEPNTYEVKIDEHMTPEMVRNKILSFLK